MFEHILMVYLTGWRLGEGQPFYYIYKNMMFDLELNERGEKILSKQAIISLYIQ